MSEPNRSAFDKKDRTILVPTLMCRGPACSWAASRTGLAASCRGNSGDEGLSRKSLKARRCSRDAKRPGRWRA